MKEIISKHVPQDWVKRRKKDLKKVRRYWRNIYGPDYAKLMTTANVKALEKIAKDAKDVVFHGNLRQSEDGFTYVEIDNSLLKAFSVLIPDGKKPEKNKGVGAHITVMKSEEAKDIKVKKQDVSFTIKGIEEVEDPLGWDEMKKVWFLLVDAPELSEIRKEHGLSSRLNGHDFHITFAVQER